MSIIRIVKAELPVYRSNRQFTSNNSALRFDNMVGLFGQLQPSQFQNERELLAKL